MEQTELLIDMQSYAVFVCKIYIIKDLRLCYMRGILTVCFVDDVGC